MTDSLIPEPDFDAVYRPEQYDPAAGVVAQARQRVFELLQAKAAHDALLVRITDRVASR